MENKKKYQTIYNDIVRKIQSEELHAGDKLPKETELTKLYGVSRITIQKALHELEKINLIYRIKRSGTFINGKLNYKNRQLIIPVVCPFDKNYGEIYKGIDSVAIVNNIYTPYFNSQNNVKKEREILAAILDGGFDGLIIYPCLSVSNTDYYSKILLQGKPIVCLDRGILGIDVPYVTSENKKGMVELVNYLYSLGHRKIAFFAANDNMVITENERLKGYCEGLINNNLEPKNEFIYNTTDIHRKEINLTSRYQDRLFHKYIKIILDEYIVSEIKPTAVCCINERCAQGLYEEAINMSIKIPEELTIASFDCINANINKKRKIISIVQDFYKIGSIAMMTLLKLLDKETVSPIQKIGLKFLY